MELLDNMTVTEVAEAISIPWSRGRRSTTRQRKSYGLSFCLEGRLIYTLRGRRVVSDRAVAVILPMGETYDLFCEESGEFALINFSVDRPLTTDVLAIPIESPERYVKNFEHIRECLLTGKSRARVMGLFYEMLGRLSEEGELHNPVVAGSLAYITSHLSDPGLSNEVLAEHAGVSEVYLRRLFKETLQTTPKQYILELRMRLARQLLAEGTPAVSAVAEACGFSCVYHFSRAFRLAVGETPTDYRTHSRFEAL